MTLHNDIDIGGDQQLDSAQKGVDIHLLVLGDDGFTQVQAQPAAEGVKPRSMEHLALIAVGVSTKAHSTTDALAILSLGNWSLEPL